MRYVPSTKVGSLLTAAVREAAKATGADLELTRQTIAKTLATVEAHEKNQSRSTDFYELSDEMSAIFLQWATALHNKDGHLADQLEAKLDALAAAHPFSYAETKAILGNHVHCSSTHHAKKAHYRAWDTSDPSFARIKNKVSGSGKVAVIGDWGTGDPDADAILEAVMDHKPDVILHLGDIYEAGLPAEIEEHFLAPIDRVCGATRPPILTIPGNHEYFSCGEGFFQLIDVLNGGPQSDWNQAASFFCLRSHDDKYQFLGADSGLGCIDHPSSPDLQSSEIDWHRAQIENFSGKTIFMTHHQLIAVDHQINGHARNDPNGYGYWNRHFVDAFNAQIPGTTETYLDRIDLWLWGHAHWFMPFRGDLKIPGGRGTLKRGQLLGGSAREKTYRAPSAYSPHPGVVDAVAPWILHKTDLDPTAPKGELVLPRATNDDGSGQKLYNHTFAIMDLAAGEIAYYEVPSWTENTSNPDTKQLKNALLTLPI